MTNQTPFIGRMGMLKSLQEAWEKKKLFVLHGMPSVGKSRLAEQFVLDLKNLHDNLEDWRVDMKYCKEARETLGPVLENLQLSEEEEPVQNLEKHVLPSIKDRKQCFVIIYDNAEYIIETEACGEWLVICEMFLTETQNVKIVITTTFLAEDLKELAKNKEQGFITEVLPLSNTESREMLRSIAPEVDFGSYLDEIVRHCEGLPLALLLTASELDHEQTIITPEEMAELFCTRRLEVLSPMFYPREDKIAPKFHDFLMRLSEYLQDRLAILNYFPGTFNGSQAQMLLGDSSVEVTDRETLRPTVQRSVVHYSHEGMRYTIRGILRDCIQEYLKIKNLPEIRKRFCAIFSRMLKKMQEQLDTKEYQEALVCISYEHQNFLKLFTDVKYSTEDTYGMFIEVAKSATESTLHRFFEVSGFSFYEDCLKLTKMYRRDTDRACVHIAFGSALTNMKGDFVAGEKNYQSALELLDVSPTESRGYHMAEVCQRIGWNLGCQGRPIEAIRFLQRALDLETAIMKRKDKLILQTLTSLAIFYTAIGNLTNGRRFHCEALARRREKFGTDNHPQIGGAISNIGILYLKEHNFQEAYRYFSKGLEIKLATNATDKAIIISQCNMASCLTMVGRHEEALNMIQDAQILLDTHPGLYEDARADVLDAKGRIYSNMGDYSSARMTFGEAIDIRKTVSPTNFVIAENLLEMARCSMNMRRYPLTVSDLEKAFDTCLRIRKESPRSTFMLEYCTISMEINISLKNSHNAQHFYDAGQNECSRLLQAFQDVEDQPSCLKILEKQRQLKEKIINFQTPLIYRTVAQISPATRCLLTVLFSILALSFLVWYLSLRQL